MKKTDYYGFACNSRNFCSSAIQAISPSFDILSFPMKGKTCKLITVEISIKADPDYLLTQHFSQKKEKKGIAKFLLFLEIIK